MEQTIAPTLAAPQELPVNRIKPGNNPRKKITPESVESIGAAVKAFGGVYQPIIVRPIPDGWYEIIAGERRWRGTIWAFGDGAEVMIPVIIRNLTDEQAEKMALSENVDREEMTVLDIAEGAAVVLGRFKGDRVRAADAMGWKPEVFNRRIGLLYATAEVQAALRSEKITTGHAELLAAMRKESQQGALTAMLGLPQVPTISEFKAMLQRMALSLKDAIFDKADCASCQYNSGEQAALFTEAISKGCCTNKQCFDAKSEDEVAKRAKALESEYQVVKIVRPGDNFSIVSLQASGPRGVGAEQAQACRSCKNFGAAVSAMPDSLGQAYKNQCLDTTCNTSMVAARIKSEKELEEAAKATSSNQQTLAAKNSTVAAAAVGSMAAKPKEPSTASVEPSRAVTEYREKVWRAILSRVTQKADVATNRCILLALALTSARNLDGGAISTAAASMKIDLRGTSPAAVLEKALQLSTEDLAKGVQLIAAHTSTLLPIGEVVGLLKALDTKLQDHWKVNDAFFTLLTKNEIDAVCTEIGIKAAMKDAYGKAQAGKKDEYIKALMSVEGFVYENRIPKIMKWR